MSCSPGSNPRFLPCLLPPGSAGVLAAATVPLGALVGLFLLGIPLGQPDYLIYRYSPLALWRLLCCLPAWGLTAAVVWGTWRVAIRRSSDGKGGAVKAPRHKPGGPLEVDAGGAACPRAGGYRWMLGGCGLLLAAWTFVAPPRFVSQHIFNLQSPAQDGAFVWEAMQVHSARDYLATGFLERLELEPGQMRGTRVLSNPPGMTLLAVGARRLLRAFPALDAEVGAVMDWFESVHADWPEDFRVSLVFGAWLTALWALAVMPAYAMARLWLPVAPALAIAAACVWNPSTLNFTPGKDPAQMLFAMLLMWTGLRAYLRQRSGWAILCGALFTLSLMVGLIHVWIALILLAGTGWHAVAVRGNARAWLARIVVPAALGVVASWLTIRAAWNHDVLYTAWRVAQRYPHLQKYLIHGAYTFVGFPVFLLFAGPTFWALATCIRPKRDAGDELERLGACLARVAAACMIYCYFFANNNEIARLWMPFIAVLTAAMSMRRRAALGACASEIACTRGNVRMSGNAAASPSRRGSPKQQGSQDSVPAGAHSPVGLAILLLTLQLVCTTLHWSMMDAREAEWRMLSGLQWG
ncbi:MAG: hypothetical protein IT449_15540 [Phycisphaerales bacterium]|nr:hypothetical protein [Phycisphaerales bacterium]